MTIFNQVLQTWLLQQPEDYSVKALVANIREWIEEGYVDTSVWKRIQNCVTPDILPSFSKRSELRQRSMSVDHQATATFASGTQIGISIFDQF